MSDADQNQRGITRRGAFRAGAAAAGGIAIAGGMLGRAIDVAASPAKVGVGPYGPLQAPDSNGIMLPAGFTSKIIARTDQPIGKHNYPFHVLPDGMGTFKTKDGFILVSNSEAPYIKDVWEIGAAAIRFDKNFNITDAYPILKGTMLNCAGGVTPWGNWLSCEEIENGKVWECDPYGVKPAVARPAMGVFKHEACSIDPIGKKAYLTEDVGDGCFYRFSPDNYPDLSAGTLEVASVGDDGTVTWLPIADPQFLAGTPTRLQQPEADRFRRGEGMWYDEGVVYFATTQDDRVYAYHCADGLLEVLYDGVALGDDAPLHDTDNVTVSPTSGDLFVCEDPGEHQVCIISVEGEAAAFARLPGVEHERSELTGPVFDPTGHRFYFTSQRMTGGGAIFEISGPFRRTRPEPEPDDTVGPKVKIRTLGKTSLKRLLRSGQPFKLTVLDDSPPVKLEVQLITKMKRATGKGSQNVTIGRMTVNVRNPGDRTIKMKVKKGAARRLRRRDVAQARLVVIATDSVGNRKKTVKPVRFT